MTTTNSDALRDERDHLLKQIDAKRDELDAMKARHRDDDTMPPREKAQAAWTLSYEIEMLEAQVESMQRSIDDAVLREAVEVYRQRELAVQQLLTDRAAMEDDVIAAERVISAAKQLDRDIERGWRNLTALEDEIYRKHDIGSDDLKAVRLGT